MTIRRCASNQHLARRVSDNQYCWGWIWGDKSCGCFPSNSSWPFKYAWQRVGMGWRLVGGGRPWGEDQEGGKFHVPQELLLQVPVSWFSFLFDQFNRWPTVAGIGALRGHRIRLIPVLIIWDSDVLLIPCQNTLIYRWLYMINIFVGLDPD